VRDTGDGVRGGEQLWIRYVRNGGRGDDDSASCGEENMGRVGRVGVVAGESNVA
jgi:hypothetical protein